jgi:methylenetetrahydrofolate reductase (NADPH)
MKIAQSFRQDRLVVSYELFPPKTDEGVESLYRHVGQLMQFQPSFITCTYGAGGSTRDRTLQVISQVQQRFQVTVASHLTLVGSTVDDLRQYLEQARQLEIDGIVALRGDPPRNVADFKPTPGGLQYANQLVELIRREFPDFSIVVAGYPETHSEAPNSEVDLENLQRKVAAGADAVVTQLFFDNQDFFRFRDRCWARGITQPIVPGILPPTSAGQLRRLSEMCGARLPEALMARMNQQDDPQWQAQVGKEFAVQQVRELLEAEVAGLHFYVLNQSQATMEVLAELGFSRTIAGR